MLEFNAMLSAVGASKKCKRKDDTLTPEQERNYAIVLSVVIVLEIALWIWAIVRAVHCSQATPDSRAVHLLFATMSPFLYLVFSYTLLCPPQR